MFSSTKEFQRALFTNNNSVKFAFDEKFGKCVLLSGVNTLQWTSSAAHVSLKLGGISFTLLCVISLRAGCQCNINPFRNEDSPVVSCFQGRSGDLASCFLELRVRMDCYAPRGHTSKTHGV